MISQDFLASVSLEQLKMMQRVFSQVRREFGYAHRSWKAQALTDDLIRAIKSGVVTEKELREQVVALRRGASQPEFERGQPPFSDV